MTNNYGYYLYVDGILVDFSCVKNFPNMENFFNLCLFTGIFENKEELFFALRLMGLVTDEQHFYVTIVKKNEKTGKYSKTFLSVIYKKSIRFITRENIIDLLYSNRHNTEALKYLLELYKYDYENSIALFENRFDNLLLDKNVQAETIAKLRKKILNCRYRTSNVEILLNLLQKIAYQQTSDNFTLSDILERIRYFVETETCNTNSRKNLLDYKKLRNLISSVTGMTENFPYLSIPALPVNLAKIQSDILTSLRQSIVVEEPDCDCLSKKDQIDPDSYMFLEPEDYENIYSSNRTPEQQMSIEDSILFLLERKSEKKRERKYRNFFRIPRI